MSSESNKAWNKANPERCAEACRRWRANRSAEAKARDQEKARAWKAAHKEQVVAVRDRWIAANPERHRANVRAGVRRYRAKSRDNWIAYQRLWAELNPDRRRSYKAKRRALELRAVPAWVDFDAIRAIYAASARATAETGIAHHVDHYVPLNNPLVCGLHWAGNLQVMPAAENLRKANKWAP